MQLSESDTTSKRRVSGPGKSGGLVGKGSNVSHSIKTVFPSHSVDHFNDGF